MDGLEQEIVSHFEQSFLRELKIAVTFLLLSSHEATRVQQHNCNYVSMKRRLFII
jgi:hypothetical protein